MSREPIHHEVSPETTEPSCKGVLKLDPEIGAIPWEQIRFAIASDGKVHDVQYVRDTPQVLELITILPGLTREQAYKAIETLNYFKAKDSDFDIRRLRHLSSATPKH